MSESMGDLLAKRGVPSEPPEIAAIKKFVIERVGVTPNVVVGQSQITISMPSSAAAGALRMTLFELEQELKPDKRLVIRIGR